jgi:hypothetical protein
VKPLLANASTRRTLPIATKLNLGHVLQAVGERTNPEEVVLFSFLTSHGSRSGLGLESSGRPEDGQRGECLSLGAPSLLDQTRIRSERCWMRMPSATQSEIRPAHQSSATSSGKRRRISGS